MSVSVDVKRGAYRLCVAPMMDWTDRHCRFFHRLISPAARLYTEMITTGAILHGNQKRLLDFDSREHPVALQIGGSEPGELALAARAGEQWGYDEINLNCGCPSERVVRGAFGACLMREPQLVADCIKAMQDAVRVPVTVKHRIGLDKDESYALVRDFVGTLYETGCRVFLVHARNAVLRGLSPKENREIPPLRYGVVTQLKQDFPDALVVANGGLMDVPSVRALLAPDDGSCAVDGVMIGRAAYHHPWFLHELSQLMASLFPKEHTLHGLSATRQEILPVLEQYFESQRALGVSAKHMTRHWHGLFHGLPGARQWRREIGEGALGPLTLFEKLNASHQPAQML